MTLSLVVCVKWNSRAQSVNSVVSGRSQAVAYLSAILEKCSYAMDGSCGKIVG